MLDSQLSQAEAARVQSALGEIRRAIVNSCNRHDLTLSGWRELREQIPNMFENLDPWKPGAGARWAE